MADGDPPGAPDTIAGWALLGALLTAAQMIVWGLLLVVGWVIAANVARPESWADAAAPLGLFGAWIAAVWASNSVFAWSVHRDREFAGRAALSEDNAKLRARVGLLAPALAEILQHGVLPEERQRLEELPAVRRWKDAGGPK